MKSLMKKTLLAAFSVILVLFCLCGCMQTTSSIDFKWDGSFDYSVDYRVLYSAFGEGDDSGVQNSLAEWKSAIEKSEIGAQFEDTSDDEYGGLKFTANFADVAALDASEIAKEIAGIIAPTVGNTDGVMLKFYSSDHIFYKTYQIKGDIPNFMYYFGVDPATLGEAERTEAYQVKFAVSTPLKLATKANASVVEGNTYIWESTGNDDIVTVDITTSVPTVWGFVLLGVILLAIIAVIVVLILKHAKKKADVVVYDEFGNPVVAEEEAEDDTAAMEAAEKEFYQEESAEEIADATDSVMEETVEELAEEAVEETTENEE